MFKDRLRNLHLGKLLINLNDYTSQADGVTTVDKAGIEALKSDNSYNNAFVRWFTKDNGGLTEQDIKSEG